MNDRRSTPRDARVSFVVNDCSLLHISMRRRLDGVGDLVVGGVNLLYGGQETRLQENLPSFEIFFPASQAVSSSMPS